MARIEGTGIKIPSKKASRIAGEQKVASSMSAGSYGGYVDAGDARGFVSTDQAGRMLANPEKYKMRPSEVRYLRESMGLPRAQAPTETFERRDFFSMTKDPRNEVKVASADIGTAEGFNQFVQKDFGISTDSSTYQSFPNFIKGDLRKQYQDSLKFKEGTQINQAPDKKEKPTIGERIASFTGGVFNTLTGTQSAVAQTKEVGDQVFKGGVSPSAYSDSVTPQYQINREQNRPSNLDAAKTSIGDTSFASYRMGGGEQQNESGTVVSPTATVSPTRPQYEINRSQNRPSVSGAVNKDDTSFSSYVRSGGEGQKRGNVSPASTGAPRQTVASLPSNYKKTEAESFRKAAAFKEAQGIAKRNPNVRVGVDSKGQPRATATNNSGVARAQAMAVNRKLSGTKPKSARQRAQDAAKARKAAGPNRKMSAGQQTRSQAGASARTAQGNRARVRANARKRAQAAARRRRKNKKKKCDIFLKYNISPLTNMNLIRDDLAEVAYFVKEIQK